jgi:putative membrane protein
MRYLVKWGISAVALLAAVFLIPGIHVEGENAIAAALVTAAVLAVLNVIVKPILTFFSCGCIAATLGLFLFVINAVVLWAAAWISVHWFGTGFRIDGFVPALLGSIVVSVVSWLLSMMIEDKPERQRRRGF